MLQPLFPDGSDFLCRDVLGSKVNAVGLGGERYVWARVDQELGSPFSVGSADLGEYIHGFSGQGFEIARAEIFLPQLDVFDCGAGGFPNFLQQAFTTGGFVTGKGRAVSNVVEKAAFRHQLQNQ